MSQNSKILFSIFSAVLCVVTMEVVHVAAACSCSGDAVSAAVSVEDQTAVNKKMIHINYQATQRKQQKSL